jgi:hypothetical protein
LWREGHCNFTPNVRRLRSIIVEHLGRTDHYLLVPQCGQDANWNQESRIVAPFPVHVHIRKNDECLCQFALCRTTRGCC